MFLMVHSFISISKMAGSSHEIGKRVENFNIYRISATESGKFGKNLPEAARPDKIVVKPEEIATPQEIVTTKPEKFVYLRSKTYSPN